VEEKSYTLDEMEDYIARMVNWDLGPPLLAEKMLKQAVEMLRSQSAT
jgi:hypothetical protein